MTGRHEGPYGPVPRYTVRIDLPQEGRTVELRSCSSQGEFSAAAAAVQVLHRREPRVAIGAVTIAEIESLYIAESDDIVDYWDVA